MSNPIDILWKLIAFMPLDSMRRKPGETISRLPAKDREILQNLKSDDTMRMRYIDTYYGK